MLAVEAGNRIAISSGLPGSLGWFDLHLLAHLPLRQIERPEGWRSGEQPDGRSRTVQPKRYL
jgi:hypothetical protein